MKVILLQDVAKIGRRSEVVDVPNGYALNKLLPHKLAEAATPENLKRAKAQAAKTAAAKADTAVQFGEAIASLKDTRIEIKAQANEKGHLFEAIKPAAIVAAAAKVGATLTENEILITAPLKELGEHTILLKEGPTQSEVTVMIAAQ